MSWFSAFVLYAVIWFLTLFVVLPLRLTTQAEAGRVVPGTPESAPANPMMKRRLIVTTVAGTAIWVVVAGIIISGWITIADLDRLYGR
jgi:predicted secreted protein